MFLCLKFFLAHLIADFALQFEELYRLKVKSWVGHVLHVITHFVVSILLVFPYLDKPFIWVFAAGMTGVHYLQDTIKYHLQKNTKVMFLCFTIDQIVHFAVICLILLFPVGREKRGFPNLPLLNYFYYDNLWTHLLSITILSTFGAAYWIHAFRKSYVAGTRPDHGITSMEMSAAFIERLWACGFFLFAPSPLWLIASPLGGLIRIVHPRLRDRTDFLLSFATAALIGFCYRRWVL